MRAILIFSLIVFAGLAIVFKVIVAERKQAPARAQAVSEKTNDSNALEIADLRVPEDYPPQNQAQMKSLLEAAKALPLSNNVSLLIQVKMQTFRTNGQPQWLVQTPRCFHDSDRHAANSTEPLHVQTADGKFYTDGDGFLWTETNSMLVISNHVHTAVFRSALTNSFVP